VIYMPGRDTARLAEELRAAGLAGDVPCAAVSHAATPRQSYVACRLEEFAGLTCGPAPLLVMVGRAMESLVAGDETALRAVMPEVVAGLSEEL